ncbi:hypothetical protein PAXINDRAFT_19300 [Paxillus involutus ATCC 200175]|uniref:Uncharacterized protein n=1 Tax=Paxillus involutus ATCC 200175 TaxID=664439 RepID=A0A0C9SX29_PAXIN|nr:hypothetical protein PAXINDRAFT_19300 [Paxillus involutus ATCC 200175]
MAILSIFFNVPPEGSEGIEEGNYVQRTDRRDPQKDDIRLQQQDERIRRYYNDAVAAMQKANMENVGLEKSVWELQYSGHKFHEPLEPHLPTSPDARAGHPTSQAEPSGSASTNAGTSTHSAGPSTLPSIPSGGAP